MPFVAITASVIRTHRGDMNEVPSTLAIDPSWVRMLTDFCGLMDIDVRDKRAAWWLVSYWSE